jgi:hypothetical protein
MPILSTILVLYPLYATESLDLSKVKRIEICFIPVKLNTKFLTGVMSIATVFINLG